MFGIIGSLLVVVTTTTAYAQFGTTPTPLTPGAANTTSRIVTIINANNNDWNPSAVDITPQYWEQLKAEDPLLGRYEQIFITCYNNLLAGTYTVASSYQCLVQMEQGEAVWCALATYHQDKCDSTQTLSSYYYDIERVAG
jgi:hypothetical protein